MQLFLRSAAVWRVSHGMRSLRMSLMAAEWTRMETLTSPVMTGATHPRWPMITHWVVLSLSSRQWVLSRDGHLGRCSMLRSSRGQTPTLMLKTSLTLCWSHGKLSFSPSPHWNSSVEITWKAPSYMSLLNMYECIGVLLTHLSLYLCALLPDFLFASFFYINVLLSIELSND